MVTGGSLCWLIVLVLRRLSLCLSLMSSPGIRVRERERADGSGIVFRTVGQTYSCNASVMVSRLLSHWPLPLESV